MKNLLLVACLLVAMCLNKSSSAQVLSSRNLDALKKDTAAYNFVQNATLSNMKEIELGQLTPGRSSNKDVVAFGNKMVADHKKASDELRKLLAARHMNIPAPDVPAEPSGNAIRNSTGEKFDKLYIQQMLKDHQKTLALFEKASKTLEDQDLKTFASKMIPALQEHHALAEKIAKQLNISTQSGSH